VSLSIALFIVIAVLLIGLLAWALQPPKRPLHHGESVFDLLSEPRHCTRLPQILHALQPEDTEFLQESGTPALMHSLRQQRRRIALHYLDQLQEEFELLLEISRALAVMAPEVVAIQEMERWKLSAGFALNCTILRLRLRLGLRPLEGFASLSTMATQMVRHLEAATSKIAEAAVHSAELPPKGGASD
jgi:hypothetical protein